MRDLNDYVVDEQTQMPPHLMPPAFLVNADGHPFPIEYQRLVPGREHLSDLQLNPHVVVNERGQQEIIGDMNNEAGNLSLDDTLLRTQNTRRNLWKKNLVQPLDPVTLRSDEEYRINKQRVEEDFITAEWYKGDDSQTTNGCNSKTNQSKRRGRGKLEKAPEVVCQNRLTAKALYDTDAEEEEEEIEINSEDEYENDDYVEIVDDEEEEEEDEEEEERGDQDEDSKQPVATRSNTLNNRNTVYINHELQINSDSSESSEYSDWAEEEGRKTLLPPPSRTRKEKRGRRRIKIKDDDEDIEVDVEAEEESTSRITRKVRKATRVINDDDEEEDIVMKNEEEEDTSDVKPSTSTEVSPRKGRPPKRKPPQEQAIKAEKAESSKTRKTSSKSTILKDVPMKECPPEYRPPGIP